MVKRSARVRAPERGKTPRLLPKAEVLRTRIQSVPGAPAAVNESSTIKLTHARAHRRTLYDNSILGVSLAGARNSCSVLRMLGTSARSLRLWLLALSTLATTLLLALPSWAAGSFRVSPTEISDLSHQEKAYASTRPNEPIAYEYGKFFKTLPHQLR